MKANGTVIQRTDFPNHTTQAVVEFESGQRSTFDIDASEARSSFSVGSTVIAELTEVAKSDSTDADIDPMKPSDETASKLGLDSGNDAKIIDSTPETTVSKPKVK